MRQEGLPVAAYVCKDAQCDKASCQRICVRYVPKTWMGDGVLLMSFLGAVLSSAWNTSLSTRVVFKNAMFGYYMVLLHLSEGRRRYGVAWKEHCLPWQTVRNLAHLMAHAAFHCIFGAKGLPWRLSSRQERFAETHFGSVKSHWRGTPSLRDALFGEFLHNLRTKQEAVKHVFPELPEDNPVQSDEAEELSREALREATWFQAAITSGRTSAAIGHDLLHWFGQEGRAFLTCNKLEDGWNESEEPEEDELTAANDGWVEALLDESEDEVEKEAEQQLEACDDHLKALSVQQHSIT